MFAFVLRSWWNQHRVTPNHPLWINEEWKEAGEPHLGDHLLRLDGTKEILTHIRYIPGTYTVYNLEVEQDHTYFVHGVLVHNKPPPIDIQPISGIRDYEDIETTTGIDEVSSRMKKRLI
ncbi:MAG: Hint domain-containing protein [Euryarchaeota archaeon]|nr:Hint domain-containing protein [Euryarchaeota archaeon]